MTVPVGSGRTPLLDADGSNRTWPFSFLVLDPSHLRLEITALDGTVTTQTSGLVVSLNPGGLGGSVLYPAVPGTPIAATSKVRVVRRVPVAQVYDIANQGDFHADSLESALDYQVMIATQAVWDHEELRGFFDNLQGAFDNLEDYVTAVDQAFQSAVQRAIDASNNAIAISGVFVPLVGIYGSIAGMTVPVSITNLRTSGYYTPGDGGGALYYRSVSAPSHAAYTTSNGGTVYWILADKTPSILQTGGLADGSFDNATAWAKAKGAAGTGGKVRFPFAGIGDYHFTTSTDLSGALVDPEPGVKFSGIVPFYSTIRVSRAVQVAFNSGALVSNYDLTPSAGKRAVDKALFINPGDLDRSVLEPLNCDDTLATVEWNLFPSDTWNVDATATRTADSITWNLVNDGVLRSIFWPARGGMEFRAAFNAGAFARFAIVRTTAGYYCFYVNAGGPAVYSIKLLSVAVSQVSVDWMGNSDHLSWRGERASQGIRVINNKQFTWTLNGIDITTPQTVSGDIIDVGFGVFATTAITATISYMTRTRRAKPVGKAGMTLLAIGDSKTADIQGGWLQYCREALDGSCGVRVLNVVNNAVAGDNSLAQYNKLNTTGTQGASHAVVIVGTNDVQGTGGPAPATTIGNLEGIKTLLAAGFCRPIIGVFDMWYSKALAGGSYGENTVKYEQGAETREAIRKWAATNGFPCIDLSQVLGPVFAYYLAFPDQVDPIYRDNIHQTAFANKIQGEAIARTILSDYLREMTPRVAETALAAVYLAGGWTAGNPAARYSVSDDERVHLSGRLAAGTKTDGTTVYTLPRNIRPKTSRQFLATGSSGSVVRVQIATTGVMQVYGVQAGDTYITLDGISFEAA